MSYDKYVDLLHRLEEETKHQHGTIGRDLQKRVLSFRCLIHMNSTYPL